MGVDLCQRAAVSRVHIDPSLGAADLRGNCQHSAAVETGGDDGAFRSQLHLLAIFIQHIHRRAAHIIGRYFPAALNQCGRGHLHIGAPDLTSIRSQHPQRRIGQDDQTSVPHLCETVAVVRVKLVDGLFTADCTAAVSKVPVQRVKAGAVPPSRRQNDAQHHDQHQQKNQEIPQQMPSLFRLRPVSVIVIPDVFCRIFSH